MIAILAPSKLMKISSGNGLPLSRPNFAGEAIKLMTDLKTWSPQEIAEKMTVSSALAKQNFERFQRWRYLHNADIGGAAVFSYSGEAFGGLDVYSFSNAELEELIRKLRILSALYGVLRPSDQIMPYRLELRLKGKVTGKDSLYNFWGSKISDFLENELEHSLGDKVLINVASEEYFRVVKNNFRFPVIHVEFLQYKGQKPVNITVYTKRARGMFVRFMVKERIESANNLKAFDYENYCYSSSLSSKNKLVFVR